MHSNMGRGKAITDFERGQIKVLREESLSSRQIAQKLKRSQKLVLDCLKRGADIAPVCSKGRKRKLSDRDERHIANLASNSSISTARIKHELTLDVSAETIRRALHRSPHIQYQKRLLKPAQNAYTKAERLQWARDHMQWVEQWSRTIFSDEKKFNLDGPDGYAYYWHDLRKEKLIFSRRNFGGGSLMVWLGFSREYKAQLYVLDGTLNTESYIALLDTVLLPLVDRVRERHPEGVIFQQDKATAHRAASTLQWLYDHNIDVLPWMTNSPDMNITENVFGLLCREVYKDNRQFASVEELRNAILAAWTNIDQNILAVHFDSLPNRVFELIQARGSYTKY